MWRRSWGVAAAATIVFAVASGFIWRSVETARQDGVFVAEAAPMLGDIAELKGMISAEALRIAYRPDHAATGLHEDALRRIRARRFRIAERAGALSDLMTDDLFGPRLSRAARLWWRPLGDGAAAEVARLLESSAAIGRSLGADPSTIAALGVLADQFGAVDPKGLGVRLSALTEEGRRITARLAADQETVLSRAGYTFLAALALYVALMMMFVMRPLVRRVVEEGEDAAAARYDAQEKARVKQDFMSAISHELRTPLNAMLASAEALSGKAVGAECRPHVETIQKNAQAMKAQINDVLRLTGADRASASADLSVTFDPSDHALKTVDLIAAKAEEAGLDLAISIDPALAAEVEGDAAAIRKVLLALLDNAVKFTSSGGVALRVAEADTPLGLEDGARTRLRYQVIDSGRGVAPAARERIFNPFEQEQGGLDRPAQGTGLGLALARDMARAMGGDIRVESLSDAGSCFTFDVLVDGPSGAAPTLAPDPLTDVSIILLGADTPASAARVEHLTSAGAKVVFVSSVKDVERAIADRQEDGSNAAPILLVHDAIGGSELTDAVSSLADSVSLALRIGAPDLAPVALKTGAFAYTVLDQLDPRDWAEKILDARVEGAGSAGPSGQRASTVLPMARPDAMIEEETAPRVLVVDDEAANRRVMSLAFSRAGFAVDEARSGFEAIEKAKSRSYALATLDFRMDDIDGLETARRIRALASPSSGATLLLVTAEPQGIDRTAAEALNVRAVVAKPVNLAALVELAKQETRAANAA